MRSVNSIGTSYQDNPEDPYNVVVSWDQPNPANGVIRNYIVRYQVGTMRSTRVSFVPYTGAVDILFNL